MLKTKWWKYLLMGLADVEANYTVVMAYRYTTLTSIQVRQQEVHHCFIRSEALEIISNVMSLF